MHSRLHCWVNSPVEREMKICISDIVVDLIILSTFVQLTAQMLDLMWAKLLARESAMPSDSLLE